MFPEDMPPELMRSVAAGRTVRPPLEGRSAPLRQVGAEPPLAEEAGPEQTQPRGRGHLRVVK